MKSKPGFSKNFSLDKEDIGIVGSYSSFFGLLLIATILSYKTIFAAGFEFLYGGSDLIGARMSVFLMFAIFLIVFVAIPAVPLISEIIHGVRDKKWYLVLMLIFLLLIYAVALVFQFVHSYFDFAGEALSAVSQSR
ncbi:hypothetical protein [Methanoplanus endosymbiosus]|uniref:Uncharacterized protein n=1 Tax=Methanoplanus endosymbiosus TaxID=33865 RepID=A0A9E7PKW0_9EURY|nr:hypothetical protein [Methanoplanus endosymbiosus]UUX91157.1 hypothetical protein L6E24_07120 [Methanoplanus endosymbiosus]